MSAPDLRPLAWHFIRRLVTREERLSNRLAVAPPHERVPILADIRRTVRAREELYSALVELSETA